MRTKETTEMRRNRTGAAMSPVKAGRSAAGAMSDKTAGTAALLERARAEAVREAEGLGTLPEPAKLAAAPNALRGLNKELVMVLLDKLGQRAAFERTGVRLYEALMVKAKAAKEPGGPALEDLRRIRDQELEHFRVVSKQMLGVGGDPTAETPCADSSAMASSGLVKVVTDPRTSMPQSLDAMLTVELTDNAAWETLIELSRELGLERMARAFEPCLAQEQEHLRQVTAWVKGGLLRRVKA